VNGLRRSPKELMSTNPLPRSGQIEGVVRTSPA